METIRARSKDLFPAVLLTLISIIQALSLELLWGKVRESPHFWVGDWVTLLEVLQVAAVLQGILIIWLLYSSLVMRFRWVPSIWDSIIPFGIGILQFILIDLVGPDTMTAWFVGLALIFGVVAWASQTVFRRARRDPENRAFFEHTPPATLADFSSAFLAIGALLLFGLAIHLVGERSWIALLGLALANGCLSYQIELHRRFWSLLLDAEEVPEAST